MTASTHPPADGAPPESPAGDSPSLLAVFAHPDDESLASGGLLAWCAALGVEVSLLCLTHGEHGQAAHGGHGQAAGGGHGQAAGGGHGQAAGGGHGQAAGGGHGQAAGGEPAVAARPLRQVRAAELEAAAGVLGITHVRLLDHEDGMLPWVPPERLEADIRDEIGRIRPDVVITFDEDGLYWHPDHIAVHERTTAVVAALPGRAPALFHVTLPPGAMRAIVDHAARVSAARRLPRPFARSILGVAAPDAFGADAPAPTLVVCARDHATLKLRALCCHRSQFDDCALRFVGDDDAPRLLGTEHYRRSAVGAQGDTIVDRLAAAAGAS